MSVIVKSMDMPEKCSECPFFFRDGLLEFPCCFVEKAEVDDENEIDKECPLVELPKSF